MNELAVISDLKSASTDELRTELARHLTLTAQAIAHMAAVVAELERRGEDLEELKIGMLGYLRRIASGQLLADVVVRYAEFPMLLSRIAALPLQDQKKLASGEPLKLLVWREDGTETRMLDPIKMTRDQVFQVFPSGKIRDDAEQIAVMESRRGKGDKKPIAPRGNVRADVKGNCLRVGRYVVSVGDVIQAMADLRARPENDDEDNETAASPVAIVLTESQKRRIGIRAAESGKSVAEFVRTILRAYGAI